MRPIPGTPSGTVPALGKLAALHGLRGLAAVAILLYHLVWLGALTPPQWLYGALAIVFGFAVQMFFVLSAFSLAASHFSRPATTTQYVIKRYFRLAPLFATMVVYQAIQVGGFSPAEYVLNLSLLFALVPTASKSVVSGGWSVGVEVVFYIVLPVLFMLCRTAKGAGILFVGAAVVSYAASLHLMSGSKNQLLVIHSPIVNFAHFAGGLFAFFLHRDYHWKWQAMTLLIVVVVLISWLVIGDYTLGWHSRSEPKFIAILAPIFAVICLWQAQFPSWLLANPLMQYFGDRSYGIYLLQFPVITFLASSGAYTALSEFFQVTAGGAYFVAFFATLLLLLPLVEITYRLIELPGISLGRKLSRAH